jgi:acyl-CoA synthetase (NDP forming)
MSFDFNSVAPLLNPASIAVIGASSDLGRVGGMPVKYLLASGFKGGIYPVNPSRREIGGLPCYSSIAAVPRPLDLAVIVLPADRVVQAVRECAEAGVRGAVIFSAGFAELDAAGATLQEEMASIARATGMRVCGPNCAGLINLHTGATATFGSHLSDPRLIPGSIGFVSQSGAVGAYLFSLARQQGIGFSHWVTTGNEADTQVADYVGYLADDPLTRVIGIYLEQVRDAERLMVAVHRAHAAGKPVIGIKVGKTDAGRRAAVAHTAAMAGDSAVYAAALAEMGILEVESFDAFLDLMSVVAGRHASVGRRVGIITISGGVGIMMVDRCVQAGLEVPELPVAVQERMRVILPFAATVNPVDVTGNIANRPEVYAQYLELLLEQQSIDVVVAFLGHVVLAKTGQRFVSETAAIGARSGKPVWLIAMQDPEGVVRDAAASGGLPVFQDPVRCIDALGALARVTSWAKDPERPAVLARRAASASVAPGRIAACRRVLSEVESRAFLRSAGIPGPREQLVHSPEDAAAAAAALGGPVVLKVISADMPHKSAAGAVALGVTVETAAAAYSRIIARARCHRPDARLDGVLVQEYVEGEAELIIGVRRDDVFGPIVLVGAGGVLVELIRDRALALAPLDHAAAARLLAQTRASQLLQPVRGRPLLDGEAVVDLLVCVSRLAWEHRHEVASVELNPVIVRRRGEGALAVDALIELS